MRSDYAQIKPLASYDQPLSPPHDPCASHEYSMSAEETLRLTQFAIDHCSDAAFWTTAEGTIFYVNEKACSILGFDRKELLGMTIDDIDPNFQRDTWLDHWQVLKHNGSLRLESTHRTKDGHNIPVDISASYVRFGDREYYCAFARDLTEQRRIQRQNHEYEMRLNMAQRMEALGTLAGGIAHDFNNILSSILGFAELAMEGVEKSSPLSDQVREIYTAGMRAKELVNQILTFSRQSEPEKQPIQIKLIVKEVLKLLRASIPTTIHIRTNIQSNGVVMADPGQLHQILMNLATNARHAMQPDGGTLTVALTELELGTDFTTVHPEIEPGPYVQLTVADTGIGIPPELIDRIFDPFFTTKKQGEGTGLGLSVVHGIVSEHKGAITVQSQPGQGTTFHVYLPLMQLRRNRKPDDKEQLPTGHEHILLVDDENTIVNMASQTLQRLGYHVTTRTSALEALELFRERGADFDLVLTDLTMPHLPGNKLAAEMLAIRPDIPVILCTGYSGEMSDDAVYEIGIKEFIMKPILKKNLAMAVRKVLDNK